MTSIEAWIQGRWKSLILLALCLPEVHPVAQTAPAQTLAPKAYLDFALRREGDP
jgi:hypothetical protein